MAIDFSSRFYKRLSQHPARTIVDGILFVTLFQFVKFWVRQAGIYSSIKIPVSLFGPVIGYDMFTGPIIEIFNSFYVIEKWKIVIFAFLVVVWTVELCLMYFALKSSQNCYSIIENCLRLTRILTFVLIPILFLPTNYNSVPTTLLSVFAVSLTYISLRFSPRKLQGTLLLLGVLFTLLTWQESFQEGLDHYKKCTSQVVLIMKDSNDQPQMGCWISSSEKYIVLKQGDVNSPRPLIIARDDVKKFRFLEWGEK